MHVVVFKCGPDANARAMLQTRGGAGFQAWRVSRFRMRWSKLSVETVDTRSRQSVGAGLR